MRPWIYVLGGSHGEELIGSQLVELMKKRPIPVARERLAHEAAVAAGKRFLGTSQIMAHYVTGPTGEIGDPYGDPEDQAVYHNVQWLGPHLNDSKVVAVDPHETFLAGGNFFLVGPRTTRAAIAMGYELGYRRCVISLGTFFAAVQNGMATESMVSSESEREVRVEQIYTDLERIGKHGPDWLSARYDDIVDELEFFVQHELLLEGDDGARNEAVWSVLEALEEIEAQPQFSPLELPKEIRTVLQLGGDLRFGPWGHNHLGQIRPDFGLTRDGRLRRIAFGAIMQCFEERPKVAGPWVTFEVNVSRTSLTPRPV